MLLGDFMKTRKGIGYYIKFYLMSVVIFILFMVYMGINNGGLEPEWITSLAVLPLLFTAFLFLFDRIFEKIWPNKKAQEEDEYNTFLTEIDQKVNEELDLSIEDFRRLRENQRFQKALQQTYNIFKSGGNEEV